jgi:hypothetical protein
MVIQVFSLIHLNNVGAGFSRPKNTSGGGVFPPENINFGGENEKSISRKENHQVGKTKLQFPRCIFYNNLHPQQEANIV